MNEKKIYADGVELAYHTGRQDVIDQVLEIIEKRRKDINDSDLDAGTIAVVLSEWLVFEKEVLKLKGSGKE